jgi:hypothetical protein
MAYVSQGKQPRQVFVTKNDVLRKEVEKSFLNMGLAWKRKTGPSGEEFQRTDDSSQEQSIEIKFPLFLTASEWIDALDSLLPGRRFFTPEEIESRIETRREDDVVKRGVEAVFVEDDKFNSKKTENEQCRREMTYEEFRKKWLKITARVKTNMDSSQAWLEIKSFIKGSVQSLRIDSKDRDIPQNRFLTREEYIALPRKVSRINEQQRQVVYDIYELYEKMKKEGNYYDEMDVVYCLAGRVPLFWNGFVTLLELNEAEPEGLLPIDALYVDEVQVSP